MMMILGRIAGLMVAMVVIRVVGFLKVLGLIFPTSKSYQRSKTLRKTDHNPGDYYYHA
jgi:ABC-type enterochelin transport system permease subunit